MFISLSTCHPKFINISEIIYWAQIKVVILGQDPYHDNGQVRYFLLFEAGSINGLVYLLVWIELKLRFTYY